MANVSLFSTRRAILMLRLEFTRLIPSARMRKTENFKINKKNFSNFTNVSEFFFFSLLFIHNIKSRLTSKNHFSI